MPKKKQPKPKSQKSTTLTTTLYCYVEPDNEAYAKTEGKKDYGSHSSYVNALIAKDRGVRPAAGIWGPEKKRVRKKSRAVPQEKALSDDGQKRDQNSPQLSTEKSHEHFEEQMDESAYDDSAYEVYE